AESLGARLEESVRDRLELEHRVVDVFALLEIALGFDIPGALESERAPARVASPLGDFAHTDLHGSAARTDPSRDSRRGGSSWPLALGVLGLALGGGWFAWTRASQEAAPKPVAATASVAPPQAETPAPPVLPPPSQATPPAPPTPAPPAPAPAKPAAAPAKVPPPARPVTATKPAAHAKPAESNAKGEQAVSNKLLGAFAAMESQATKETGGEEAGAASVRFESQPPLHVRVGDRILGTTPVVVRLPAPGPVDVELFDTGLGLTRLEHVELKAGDNGIRSVTFQKGAIDFQLQPGIIVYVDGKKVGEAPFDKPVPLYEGKHPVRLVLEDEEERRLVTVTAGETETLEFSFSR
ncbi:MAG: PEGA domain-containing protein, partial [Myxococcaceae bacterium]